MQQNRAKNILITGCAGFIGFHLAKRLHAKGNRILGYDNFSNTYAVTLKKDRAAELQALGIATIEGDINDDHLLKRCTRTHNTTHIVNLAAQPGVRTSVTHPQACLRANVSGFLNILELCREFQLPLIYASSSSVYGLNSQVPFNTQDKTDQPASLYGATKKTNELMAHAYHHLYGIPMTAMRFFTVYGPWGRPDMSYYKFTEAILKGEPIEIYNHGKMQRDFTYIDDIVSGIEAALDYPGTYEIFNLGNHQPIALMDFIATIENALGVRAKKKFLPMQKGDVLVTHAAIEKASKKLNFHPQTSIQEGITKFVQWYKRYTFPNILKTNII